MAEETQITLFHGSKKGLAEVLAFRLLMKSVKNTGGRGCILTNLSATSTQKKPTKFERQLCSVQGKLFVLSSQYRFKSEEFIDTFMNSTAAQNFDRPYDRTQWLGEANLLQDVLDEHPVFHNDGLYSSESLFWIGYLYRYWHFLTGESSKAIYKKCDARTMHTIYPAYHTLDCMVAIERIQETGAYIYA